jgi:WD40 repeat protein
VAVRSIVILTSILALALAVRPARIAAADKPDEAEIRRLIDDLGDDDIPRRYQAAKRLAEIGRVAIAPLRKAAKDHPSEDVRLRAAVVARDAERAAFAVVREFAIQGEAAGRSVTRLALTPDGRRMLTANGNGVTLWDIETGKIVRTFDEPNRNNWALAISGDGKRAIGGGNDRTARVWDLDTGKEARKLGPHTLPVWGVALTADGGRAVVGARDRTMRLLDVETGKLLREFAVDDRVRALALSPDEQFIAASHFTEDGRPGTLRLWDMTKNRPVRSMEGHTQQITFVRFTRDGKTIITASHDGTARFWDVDSGRELKKFEIAGSHVEFAALSDDGQWLLTGGTDAEAVLRLWDAAAGTLAFTSDPVPQGFLDAAILPDGHSAVVACRDGVIRQWRWK